jgi:hypothetical protein
MTAHQFISWAILALAVWGFLSLGGAYAGTCINRQDGEYTVMSCEDGSYTVTDRHGRGFERYPGQGERPVYRTNKRKPCCLGFPKG